MRTTLAVVAMLFLAFVLAGRAVAPTAVADAGAAIVSSAAAPSCVPEESSHQSAAAFREATVQFCTTPCPSTSACSTRCILSWCREPGLICEWNSNILKVQGNKQTCICCYNCRGVSQDICPEADPGPKNSCIGHIER